MDNSHKTQRKLKAIQSSPKWPHLRKFANVARARQVFAPLPILAAVLFALTVSFLCLSCCTDPGARRLNDFDFARRCFSSLCGRQRGTKVMMGEGRASPVGLPMLAFR